MPAAESAIAGCFGVRVAAWRTSSNAVFIVLRACFHTTFLSAQGFD